MPDLSTLREQHYSPAELAAQYGLSARFVRDLFRDEKGVLGFDRPEEMHKRGYKTLRVPRSVADRVFAKYLQ